MLTLTSKAFKHSGFSMIESLVALLVISVGLLGIAALQITSLQQSSSSQWHSQAVWASYQISDRIMSNRSSFDLYKALDTNNDYDMDCESNACTPEQMVVADAQDWKELMESFPVGRGVTSSTDNNTLIISIMWEDNSDESNCVNDEPDADNMTCFTVTVAR